MQSKSGDGATVAPAALSSPGISGVAPQRRVSSIDLTALKRRSEAKEQLKSAHRTSTGFGGKLDLTETVA